MKEEAGFTLPEVVLSTVILGVIGAVLAQSMYVGLRLISGDKTGDRLFSSTNAQIVSAYFPTDVQSAKRATTTDVDCARMEPIIRLEAEDGDVTRITSYVVTAPSPDERHLERYVCEQAGTGVPNVVSEKLLAQFPCTPGPCEADFIPVSVDCWFPSANEWIPLASCDGTPTPPRFRILLRGPQGGQYEVAGTRRAS